MGSEIKTLAEWVDLLATKQAEIGRLTRENEELRELINQLAKAGLDLAELNLKDQNHA